MVPARTREEADAKLAGAGPEANILAARPEFGMPSQEWVAADPTFRQSAHP